MLWLYTHGVSTFKCTPRNDYWTKTKSKVSTVSVYTSTYLFQISQMLGERFSPAPCAGCHTIWTLPLLVSAEEPSSDRSTEVNPCGC